MAMADVVANVAASTEIEFPAVEEGIGEVEEVIDAGGEDAQDAVDGINGGEGDEAVDADEGTPEVPGEVTVETPEGVQTETPAPAAEGEDVDVERLAQLATAEASVRQERAQLKSQSAQLQQMQQRLQEQSQQAQQLISNLRTNPFETLEAAGVPVDGLIEQIVANGGEIPVGEQSHPEEDVPQWAQGMMSELKQLREEKAAGVQAQQNANNEAHYRGTIKQSASSEKYELLGKIFPGGTPAVEQAVWNLAVAHYQQTQQVLPPQEILDTLDREQRAHIQSLATHADALEAMGLQPASARLSKTPKPAGSGTETPRQNSLSGDMHANGQPRVKGKTREEQLRIAASQLNGQGLWPDLTEDDED